MSKSTTRTAFLGLTVAAALLLTGCSAGAAALVPTVTNDLGTETAAPAEPIKAPATGDIVDAATAAELKDGAEGQRGYPLDDGTFVVVTKTEPLPTAVLADAQAKTAAAVATAPSLSDDNAGAQAILGQAQGYVSKNTGKRVLIVWQQPATGRTMTKSRQRSGSSRAALWSGSTTTRRPTRWQRLRPG